VFVVGNAQDYLGYEYPADVTPFTAYGGDELIFGPSLTLGDQAVAAGIQDGAALGFPTDPTANAETAALDQQYAQVVKSGAYVLPQAVSGDLSPRTGAFTAVFDAAGSPPRAKTVCANPALVFNPGVCPTSDPAVGPFRFDFGDGSTASYAPQSQARAVFAPFVRHAYTRPGVYTVKLTVSSAGSDDTAAIAIAVHPALRVRAVRRGERYAARVSGGDGHVVLLAWRLAGGRTVRAPSVAASLRPVRVTAVDGTGTAATNRLRRSPR
jgi:hypothetical protein